MYVVFVFGVIVVVSVVIVIISSLVEIGSLIAEIYLLLLLLSNYIQTFLHSFRISPVLHACSTC